MPLPAKPMPDGYSFEVRREGDKPPEFRYIRPDGSRSQQVYRRRRLMRLAAYEDYGQRKAAEESGQVSK